MYSHADMKVMGNTTYYDRECVTSIKYFSEEGTSDSKIFDIYYYCSFSDECDNVILTGEEMLVSEYMWLSYYSSATYDAYQNKRIAEEKPQALGNAL